MRKAFLVLAAILLFTTLNPGLARASIESWYFKRHPWTLERVKRVWDEPIQVETRPPPTTFAGSRSRTDT
jgi:hypothetical protein